MIANQFNEQVIWELDRHLLYYMPNFQALENPVEHTTILSATLYSNTYRGGGRKPAALMQRYETSLI
jgi:hypothetical protein